MAWFDRLCNEYTCKNCPAYNKCHSESEEEYEELEAIENEEWDKQFEIGKGKEVSF